MSTDPRKFSTPVARGGLWRWFESMAGIGAGLVALWLGPVAIAVFLAVCLGLAVAGWKVRRDGRPHRG